MKLGKFAILGAAVFATAAIATPITLNFTAITELSQPGSTFPPVGTEISGSFVFDYDPASYSRFSFPGEGATYSGYGYSSGVHSWSAQLGTATVSTPYISIEVFDNGSKLFPETFPSDAIGFSTKKLNVGYSIFLFGPNGSFETSDIPSLATIESFWTSGTLTVRDYNSFTTVLTARVTSVSALTVPEPATYTLVLSAIIWVGYLGRRRKLIPVRSVRITTRPSHSPS
jgi:hypothetical protein